MADLEVNAKPIHLKMRFEKDEEARNGYYYLHFPITSNGRKNEFHKFIEKCEWSTVSYKKSDELLDGYKAKAKFQSFLTREKKICYCFYLEMYVTKEYIHWLSTNLITIAAQPKIPFIRRAEVYYYLNFELSENDFCEWFNSAKTSPSEKSVDLKSVSLFFNRN